jgi:sugar lactone lactonase YvrE
MNVPNLLEPFARCPLAVSVETIAGGLRRGYAEGIGPKVEFSGPRGIAIIPTDGSLYVADSNNNRIHRLAAPAARPDVKGR